MSGVASQRETKEAAATSARVKVRKRRGRPMVFFVIAFFLVVTSLKSKNFSSEAKSGSNDAGSQIERPLDQSKHAFSSDLKSSNQMAGEETGTQTNYDTSEEPSGKVGTTTDKSERHHTTTEGNNEAATTEGTPAKPKNETSAGNETEGMEWSMYFNLISAKLHTFHFL